MVIKVLDHTKRNFPYYDSRTGLDLTIVRSVDITSQCPGRRGTRKKVIVDFTQATEGIMIQITDCYPRKDIGASVANFINSFENKNSVTMGNFCRFAKDFGLTPEQLMEIVRKESPQIDKNKLIADFKVFKEHDGGTPYFWGLVEKSGLTLQDLN